jgi:hypothetical protein
MLRPLLCSALVFVAVALVGIWLQRAGRRR